MLRLISETVKVLSIDPKTIRVEAKGSDSCNSCSSSTSCGQYLLVSNSSKQQRYLEFANDSVDSGVVCGDEVQLTISKNSLLKFSLLFYLLPLLTMLIAMLSALAMNLAEVWLIMFTFAGLGLGVIALNIVFKFANSRTDFQLALLAKYQSGMILSQQAVVSR